MRPRLLVPRGAKDLGGAMATMTMRSKQLYQAASTALAVATPILNSLWLQTPAASLAQIAPSLAAVAAAVVVPAAGGVANAAVVAEGALQADHVSLLLLTPGHD